MGAAVSVDESALEGKLAFDGGVGGKLIVGEVGGDAVCCKEGTPERGVIVLNSVVPGVHIPTIGWKTVLRRAAGTAANLNDGVDVDQDFISGGYGGPVAEVVN